MTATASLTSTPESSCFAGVEDVSHAWGEAIWVEIADQPLAVAVVENGITPAYAKVHLRQNQGVVAHHSLIACHPNHTQTPASLPSSTVPTTTHATLNPSAPAFTPPSSSASLCAGSNKVVFLQTALAEISNPRDPSRVLNARIVMDGGSQKSYLTQRVKQFLSLPVTGTQQLSIAAFGSTRREPKLCEVVRLAVRTKSGSNQELNLFVVPHICDPLTTQTVSSCSRMYSHLAHLDLADISPDETLEVDMLIGSDFYWEFVTGQTIRGQGGPVTVETTLGWVLSGPAELSRQRRSTVSLITTHSLRVEG